MSQFSDKNHDFLAKICHVLEYPKTWRGMINYLNHKCTLIDKSPKA
jgi:hypothetical protein